MHIDIATIFLLMASTTEKLMAKYVQVYKYWNPPLICIGMIPMECKLPPQPLIGLFFNMKSLGAIVHNGGYFPCGLLKCYENPNMNVKCHGIEPKLSLTPKVEIIWNNFFLQSKGHMASGTCLNRSWHKVTLYSPQVAIYRIGGYGKSKTLSFIR